MYKKIEQQLLKDFEVVEKNLQSENPNIDEYTQYTYKIFESLRQAKPSRPGDNDIMVKEQDLTISIGKLVVKYLDYEIEFCYEDEDEELKNALMTVRDYVDDCVS